jgi:DNA-directed RNA polymerase specialized sigma24 family protein
MAADEASGPHDEFSESAEALLVRMRAGDRSAAARFMELYGVLIRLRVRDKLSVGLRRVMDSEDVLSTVARRLDGMVLEGRLRAQTAPELWSLVQTVAFNAVSESHRESRAEPELDADGRVEEHEAVLEAVEAPTSPEAESSGLLVEAMDRLGDEADQRVLSMWLRGSNHTHIARSMGLEPSTVRMRWSRLVRVLRSLGRGEDRCDRP